MPHEALPPRAGIRLGAARTRADLRGVGIGGGVGLDGGDPRRGVVAIPSLRGRAGRERSLNASFDETSDQITRPVVESRELRVIF
jgi:hypothetical protein